MSKRYTVRDANDDDFFTMAENLGKWMKLFPAYQDDEVDVAHTIKVVTGLLPMLHGQVLIDTFDNDKLVGFLIYTLSPSMWSKRLEAVELVFVVEEGARNFYNAVNLINKAGAQAFALGATRIILGNSSMYNDEGVAKLYTRLGFTPHSGNFIKEE